MSQDTWPDGPFADIADLAERREALRQAASMSGADPRALLDAAFAELDAAVEVLGKLAEADQNRAAGEPSDSSGTERGLLRSVFQDAPAPLFVLGADGAIRQANHAAAELIGAAPGYATGRLLTTFVDLPHRAALASQLAAAARTGTARHAECRLLGQAGGDGVTLTANAITQPDGERLLIVTAGGVWGGGQPSREQEGSGGDTATLRAMTRRLDMVTEVTRLLLDNSTFSEAVTLQRCARLLAGDIASWVIVDVERSGRLQRQFAVGPSGDEELARKVRSADPPDDSVPAQVHAAGRSVVQAYAENSGVLGAAGDGAPLLMQLGVTSLLSVPICDDGTSYGVLTLARKAAEGSFELADLALAEDLGQHLGVAIRVDRMFRHRSAVAEALQSSLLPASLPEVPGLELAAAYLPASEGLEASGDFYDVFPVDGGWAMTVGDVCGKGREAAAMTAAARHAVRVIAHWEPDPVNVLAKANEVILAGDYEDRFVTVKLACLRWDGNRVRVDVASSGHPGPAVVRPDGRVDVLSGGGMPLGLFPDAEPDRETIDLGPGDLLFFYSDGVTEARSEQMEYFEDRLADELAGMAGKSAAEATRMMQGLVSDFSQQQLRDDLTILVAKVTG